MIAMTPILRLSFVFCCWLTTMDLFGHQYSMSTATVEDNPRTKRSEIAVQVFNHDFDPVVKILCKNQMKTSGSPRCNEDFALESYVSKKILWLRHGKQVKLNWVGAQRGVQETVMFLEAPFLFDKSRDTLKHELLKDVYPKQKNRVSFRKP
ncbi:MAG: hypothetical protein HRU19_01685 [Pseudobacteriovorax sp.]|nr:hypothetical protein [Pseudobacteriovorax sp.]